MRCLTWYMFPSLQDRIRHFAPHLKGQVRRAMDEISRSPEAGKLLTENLVGCRSFRIGKYRLIYRIRRERLEMITIGPRETVYETIVLEIARDKIRERAVRYKIRK